MTKALNKLQYSHPFKSLIFYREGYGIKTIRYRSWPYNNLKQDSKQHSYTKTYVSHCSTIGYHVPLTGLYTTSRYSADIHNDIIKKVEDKGSSDANDRCLNTNMVSLQ